MDPQQQIVQAKRIKVDIVETKELYSHALLGDGTMIRFKSTPTEAHRLEGLFDASGNPVYQVATAQTVVVENSPGDLKKGAKSK